MQESKFALRSMTVVGALLTSVMVMWDGSITAEEKVALEGGIKQIIIHVGEAVGLIMAIVGRFRAKSQLSLKPKLGGKS